MKIIALAGGVGGAKLAHGLSLVLNPKDLTIIVNTGDDFEHYGLYICPDLDTVCYTLGGLANPNTGWGQNNETWSAIDAATLLGGPKWFNLGDKDLGTHLERTRRIKNGESLSNITREFCRAWNIKPTILPMSDQTVQTMVKTNSGELAFQEYFVHQRCEPKVTGFRFENADRAEPAPGIIEALENADAVIICPSNPWVSIDPILAVIPKMQKPVFAVSPIIDGQTIKGPAAKMYKEMGINPSSFAVANHYKDLITGFILDSIDEKWEINIKELNIKTLSINTIMNTIDDRKNTAAAILKFIGEIL